MQREFNPKEIVLSHTRLGHFQKSPLTFKTNWIDRTSESTDAMIKGSLTHALINKENDPKLIEKYHCFQDGFDLKSKARQEEWAAVQVENKIPMKFKDYNEAVGMAAAVSKHEIVKTVIRPDEPGQNEMLIEWVDKRTGIKLKGFIDRWLNRKGLVVDFKSGADASNTGFPKQFFKLNNHRQIALYFDGLLALGETPKLVTNIVVEATYPHNIGIFNITDEVLLEGRKQYEKLLDDYIYCMEKDLFNMSYEFWSPTRIHDITLPGWMKK